MRARAKPSLPHPILLVVSGVCQGAQGPGGWGYVSCDPTGNEWTGYGAGARTTANRMELLAAIEGLKALGGRTRSTPVRVVSASQYLVEGATGRRERKANTDLWARLDAELSKRSVAWEWEPPDTMLYQVQAYELARQGLRRVLQSEPPEARP